MSQILHLENPTIFQKLPSVTAEFWQIFRNVNSHFPSNMNWGKSLTPEDFS